MRRIVWPLCLVALLSVRGESAGSAATRRGPAVTSTARVNFTLLPDRGSYPPAGPIPVHVRLTNRSPGPLVLWEFAGDQLAGTYMLDFRLFHLQGARRQEVPLTRPFVPAKAAHPYVTVKLSQGQSFSRAVDLRAWLGDRALEPGTYEIQAIWDDAHADIYGPGRTPLEKGLTSAPARITITPG